VSASPKKAKTAKTKKGSLKPSWKSSPITKPQEYINSVTISGDGSVVVAGMYYFPYSAGAKHSAADTGQIAVGTFTWNAKGALLYSLSSPFCAPNTPLQFRAGGHRIPMVF
jgi:hypothetical protein